MAVMMPHLVKFLLLKHEDLNLNSQHSHGKPRAVASNYHPNLLGQTMVYSRSLLARQTT